jgi:hypothetical protein
VSAGEVVPILVAARYTSRPWGRFTVLRTSPQAAATEMDVILEGELEVAADEFTVGWNSVKLPEDAWPAGSVGTLHVEIGDDEERDDVSLAIWSEGQNSNEAARGSAGEKAPVPGCHRRTGGCLRTQPG